MLNNYEISEIALTLMTSGWTADDKDEFIEQNANQIDAENVLDIADIEAIFKVIAKQEKE